MKFSNGFKTASGTLCGQETWKVYVNSLLDKENARDMIRGILVNNQNNMDTIKVLRELLQYRPELLSYMEKISVLL